MNSTLQVIGLHDNGIGDDGARVIAEAMEFNSSLQWIDLSDNGIASEEDQDYIWSETSFWEGEMQNMPSFFWKIFPGVLSPDGITDEDLGFALFEIHSKKTKQCSNNACSRFTEKILKRNIVLLNYLEITWKLVKMPWIDLQMKG